MSMPSSFQRRDFLKASAALGGGLLIAMQFPSRATAVPANAAEPFAPNAFLRLATDGKITVMINKSEMGQGVSTALAMLVAEEFDADWKDVGFEFAPVDPAYNHPGFPMQFTGGSTSVLGMSEPLKQAGAMGRALIIAAASQRWNVPASQCTTNEGVVTHSRSGKHASYGELASTAALMPLPNNVVLKDPATYRILGKPTRRLDTPDKVTGRAVFGLDVSRPGMLTALVAHPPVFGGKALRFNEAAALAIPGVRNFGSLKFRGASTNGYGLSKPIPKQQNKGLEPDAYMKKTTASENAICKPGTDSRQTTPGYKSQKRAATVSRDMREDRGTRQMKATHNSQTLPHGR